MMMTMTFCTTTSLRQRKAKVPCRQSKRKEKYLLDLILDLTLSFIHCIAFIIFYKCYEVSWWLESAMCFLEKGEWVPYTHCIVVFCYGCLSSMISCGGQLYVVYDFAY
eukprot:TRINITY_DN10593_c0_g1_i1.p1 TRINITY_DN10593_c0_g1~~TRINITY_DN10593_c0_g1_i1.p1  ORF type:complete len:108 (+),score=8.42 TRINITY_DN10593_c0_g1_i1:136-459(+)